MKKTLPLLYFQLVTVADSIRTSESFQLSFQLNGQWKSSLYTITSHINIFQWQNISGRCHYSGLSIVILHSYYMFVICKKRRKTMNINKNKNKNMKKSNTSVNIVILCHLWFSSIKSCFELDLSKCEMVGL